MENLRTCIHCNEERPIDNFYFNKKRNYRYPTCNECKKSWRRIHPKKTHPNLPNETWKTHPEYTEYEISDKGRVKRKDTGRVLSPGIVKEYRYVHLPKEPGKYKNRYVHRLVLETFVGLCPPNMECSHLNRDRSDNRVENLQWESHKDNQGRMGEHGVSPRGERSPWAKLKASDIPVIRQMILDGVPAKVIASKYDMSASNVHHINRGDSWIHI